MSEPPVENALVAAPIGKLFVCEERRLVEVTQGLGSYTAVVNEPPWSTVAASLRPPVSVVVAGDMELAALEDRAGAAIERGDTVVGVGGGTALDTAKFLAWKWSHPLVQVPTITSVDAAFTDAIGVRVDGRVRYVGTAVPDLVVLDVDLIRSAPARLNRAGIGDVLSCHTGLFDWRLASSAGEGPIWNEALADLGETLLEELDHAVDDVRAVSVDGVRFLAHAYRRIGAAAAAAGHSRFEEGSEHFWAYAYEHATGVHQVHGELVACGVATMSVVQGNRPEWVRSIIRRGGVRAHPADLGISLTEFAVALSGLSSYARADGLDVSVVDLRPPTPATVDDAWAFACSLPRDDELR